MAIPRSRLIKDEITGMWNCVPDREPYMAKTICEKYPKKLTFSTASRAASLICPYLARTGVFVKQRDGRSITYKFNEKEVQREQLNAFLDAERKRQIELERGVLN
jgi:hypothetical protein